MPRSEVQTEGFNKDVARTYHEQMSRRDIPQPRVILTFSAIPGSGKTTLAKKLADDLEAQYLHHDDIRDDLRAKGIDPTKIKLPPISRIIMRDIMAEDANKFIVLDASIDRAWEVYFETVAEAHAQSIVIRFDLPLAVIEDRIRQRDGDDDSIRSQLQRFQSEFDACCEQVKADLTLGEEYDYSEVANFVRKKISQSRPHRSHCFAIWRLHVINSLWLIYNNSSNLINRSLAAD